MLPILMAAFINNHEPFTAVLILVFCSQHWILIWASGGNAV